MRLLLCTLMFLAPVAHAAAAQDVAKIRVSGEGQVAAVPDMAIISLTVTREADTARAALDANNQAMKDVLSAMQKEGIKKKDLQTSGFSIQPRYVYPQLKTTGERQPPKIAGYTVRNSLSVRLRDITMVGKILDMSVTLGVNEGGSIQFTNSKPGDFLEQAREAAVKDAVARAKTIAAAAGVGLGNILEIAERSNTPGPVPMARAEMAMMRASDSVPVANGENAYRVNIDMTFRIEQ